MFLPFEISRIVQVGIDDLSEICNLNLATKKTVVACYCTSTPAILLGLVTLLTCALLLAPGISPNTRLLRNIARFILNPTRKASLRPALDRSFFFWRNKTARRALLSSSLVEKAPISQAYRSQTYSLTRQIKVSQRPLS